MPSQGAPKKTRRTPRSSARSRAAILQAAKREFATKGLGGARVDEIARVAGVNKALLYHYFGNKDDLFVAVLEEAYESIRSAEAELGFETLEPAAAMAGLVDFTWQYFLENPEFISLLNSENLHGGRHLGRSERVRAMHHPLVARMKEILERGQRSGAFRSGVDAVQLYISIAALGYFYLSNSHTLGKVFGRKLLARRELEERRRHIQDVVAGYLSCEVRA